MDFNVLEIQGIPRELYRELKKLAEIDNKSTPHYIRESIKKSISAIDTDQEFPKERKHHTLLHGVSNEFISDLDRVSNNVGVTKHQLLRVLVYLSLFNPR